MGVPRQMRLAAARRLMADGRHEEADRLADDLLADAPRDIDALVLKSAVLTTRGDRERAFTLLAGLAEAAPGRADICANLGLLHRLEGRGAEARLCYERAVELEPTMGPYGCALVGILLSLGDLEAARHRLRALAATPSVDDDAAFAAEVHGLDARIALLEHRPAAAERAVRRALALRPDDEGDLVLLSDALAQLGDGAGALEAAEQAYLRAPASHDHACLLARRLMEAGRMDAAERHLLRIAATAPLNAEAAFLLAHVRIAKGAAGEAVAQFAALVRRVPGDPELLMRMATLLRLTGDLDKALACATEAARLAPDTPSYGAWRDELRLALGEVDVVWPQREPAPDLPGAVVVPAGMPAGEALLLARFVRGSALVPPPVCHVEPALLSLLDGVPGLRLSTEDAPLDTLALAEWPRLCRTDAAPPYLAVEAGRLEAWMGAFPGHGRPRIGVFWDPRGGLDLKMLAAWVRDHAPAGATLVSLAFDGRRADLADDPAILDAGDRFRDAKDLVAAVAAMDFVVAADGLPAHVAGALGRSGLVAVPPSRPWAWAHSEGRAVWYPSLRVACAPDMRAGLDAHGAFVRAELAAAGRGEA